MTPMLAISPLSPERVWAMRERGILIRAPLWGRPLACAGLPDPLFGPGVEALRKAEGGLGGRRRQDACPTEGVSCNHLHTRVDFAARNQGRPVGHDLAHLGPAFAISGAARRTGEYQRNHLAREAIHGALVGAAHADAHLHLRRIVGRPRRRAVAGIHTEVFGVDFVKAQPKLIEALPRDAVRHARLLDRVGPTVDQRGRRLPPHGVPGPVERDRPPPALLPARGAPGAARGPRPLPPRVKSEGGRGARWST